MIPMIPIAPTIRKNDVRFIITSYFFFGLDFAINLKPKKANIKTTPNPIKNKDTYSISCFIKPARMTPPKINFAISKQNLPASINTPFVSWEFGISFFVAILILQFDAAKVQLFSDICKFWRQKMQIFCKNCIFTVNPLRQRSLPRFGAMRRGCISQSYRTTKKR